MARAVQDKGDNTAEMRHSSREARWCDAGAREAGRLDGRCRHGQMAWQGHGHEGRGTAGQDGLGGDGTHVYMSQGTGTDVDRWHALIGTESVSS